MKGYKSAALFVSAAILVVRDAAAVKRMNRL